MNWNEIEDVFRSDNENYTENEYANKYDNCNDHAIKNPSGGWDENENQN